MKNKLLYINFLSLILTVLTSQIFAQQSDFYKDPILTYTKAKELFDQKAFGPAEKMFEKVSANKQLSKDNVLVEEASFHSLICAVKLKQGDAFSKAESFLKNYPYSAHLPAAYFYMGKLYFEKRKYRQALEVFSKTQADKLSASEKNEFFFQMGYAYLKINRPDQALKYFEKVMEQKNPYQEPAQYYYAHIQYLKKNYDEALKLFKKLENNRRYKKYIPEYLIHIYFEKKQYDKVISIGEKLYQKAKNKTKGEIAGLLGNAYYALGEYQKALTYYQVYERYGRKITPEEHYRIGVTKYQAKHYKEAIKNFEKATALKNEIAQTAWYYLGFCYLNTNQDKFARDSFLKAYRMDYNKEISDDALLNYIKATIKSGGDPYNDEIKILETFIKNHKNTPILNEAYDLLVQLFITSKDYRQALNSLDKITRMNPRLKEIYQELAFNNGIELFRRSDFKTALEFFNKALKYPGKPEIYTQTLFWKAETLYRLKNYQEALTWYQRFLSRKYATQTKYYPMALYGIAYTNFHLKKYDQAITYFKRFLATEKAPANLKSDAELRIADCYYIKKEFDKAIEYYSKVIEKGAQDSDYALYQKASCYGAKGNFNKKISTLILLTKQFKRSPLYADALYEIGSTYLTINDQRHAIASFDRIVKEKPKSLYAKKALMKIGLLYYSNNQNNQAKKIFKQVIKKYPASTEATEALNALKNIYTETGKVDEYLAFAKNLDFIQVSTSEADSLTFASGENFYLEHKCNEAIDVLSKYLSQFPEGGFVIKAHYYLAQCFSKKGDLTTALHYFEKVLNFPDNPYTVKALTAAARISFDNKDFKKAYRYYAQLMEIGETKSLLLESLDGMMRSAFYLNNLKKAATAAHQLLKTEKVSEDQIVFAHYVLAKAAYDKGNMQEAAKEFNITDKLTSGEWGAEAKYYLAKINFDQKEYDKAEKEIYALSDHYPEYPYWVAKGYILLADIYLKRGNAFQAKQTLKSIIDHYNGEDLRKIAQKKLDQIKAKEALQQTKKEEENHDR